MIFEIKQRLPQMAGLSLAGVRLLAASVALGAAIQVEAQDALSMLPEGQGREIVAESCATCHSIGMVTSQGRSEQDWTDTIDRMRAFGASFSDETEASIAAYLAEHFPPEQDPTDFLAMMEDVPVGGEQQYPRPTGEDQWPAYGGGPFNQNFSELTQITPDNVSQLEVAWVFNSGTGEHDMGDQGIDYRFEVTPLLIGGIMYLSTPASPAAPGVPATITALVPETGEVIWRFESPYNIHGRGIAYWPGDGETSPRIIFGTDRGYIMAVDVTTGTLAPEFGLNGVIDAYVGVASEIVGESRREDYTVPNPVTIYEDLIITGARPGEANPPGPRGDIRAFSAQDGRLEWTFHTAPQPGEPHADLIPQPEEYYDLSGANVWSTMTLDPENGIVYASTGDLNARVTGPELFSSSLLALDASTGDLIWYQQITHKDMWDWDSPTPPVLMELQSEGEAVPAVLLTGKHGLVFLFNRLTGESLNGLEERPTPRTNIPGVDPWPTQPFPAAPGPIALNSMTRDEIPDYVPGMKEHCEALWDEIDPLSEGLYSLPRADRPTIGGPGATGGPNWGGGSYSPELGYYFINVQNRLRMRGPTTDPGNFVIRNRVPDNAPQSAMEQSESEQPQQQPEREPLPSFTYEYEGVELSCAAGPVGALVAVDLNNLDIAWQVPLGWQENLGEAGRRIGRPNLGGSIVTASGLVFIGAANDSYFRAFDARNGNMLWEAPLPAGGHSTPITYMGEDGSQYVVIVAAGGTSVGRRDAPRMSDSLVAFKLPN